MRNVLLAAAEAGATRIVHTSSVAAIGFSDDGAPADEDTPGDLARMIGPYKRSKYLADVEARRLAAEDGVPVVIVNPAAPFGARDIKPTPTGGMVVAFGRGVARVGMNLGIGGDRDLERGDGLQAGGQLRGIGIAARMGGIVRLSIGRMLG